MKNPVSAFASRLAFLTIEENLPGYLLNEISQEVRQMSQFILMFSAQNIG